MNPVESIPYPLRVVAIGGGTGLPVVLRGMKAILFPQGADDPTRLTAVVTVTDEGGSSGRLRENFRMPPPGDIRNCLVALSHNEPLMARLFQARYRASSEDLEGHAVGNLILAALAQEEEGGFLAAVQLASEVLNIQGRVFPASLLHLRLVAQLAGGEEVVGETALAAAGRRVERLRLAPADAEATPGVVEAIHAADIVVLGPGSLFTSILPNVLIADVAEALRATNAFRVLVVNGMTEAGETTGYGAADHVRAFAAHAGEGCLDAVLLASDPIPAATLERYRSEGAGHVDPADAEVDRLVGIVERRPLLQVAPKVRHDPLRTAGAVLSTYARFLSLGRPRPARSSGGRR